MTENAATQTSEQTSGRRSAAPRRLRLGAVIAIALAIGFGLWLALRDDGGSSNASSPVPVDAKAVPVSASGLRTLASVGIPIYWIGEEPGVPLELAKTADNKVYIRYLPHGAAVGTRKPYLTIGTFPMKAAYSVTAKLAEQGSSTKLDAGKDAVAYYKTDVPTTVFLAYPGLDYQIEVFDPSPGRARDLVTSRQVVPVK